MKTTEQIFQQIERALRKALSKFPTDAECLPLTDLYLQVKQESGELRVYDDDDNELTRCVVAEWIGNRDESFYTEVQPVLKQAITRIKDVVDNAPILKPYSFVLIGEDKETVCDLYLVDDETIVLNEELMQGLGQDLDSFWEQLSKEDA